MNLNHPYLYASFLLFLSNKIYFAVQKKHTLHGILPRIWDNENIFFLNVYCKILQIFFGLYHLILRD